MRRGFERPLNAFALRNCSLNCFVRRKYESGEKVEKFREEMQGGMACYLDPPGSIPLMQKSVRFAVSRRNGLSSNSWRVWNEKAGDVYIVCSDHLEGMKISLHRSGRRHIVSNQKAQTAGDRFMGQWDRPLVDEMKSLRPFRLVFPTSALCVNQEAREKNATIWAKNRVYIEAPESPFGTTVSFITVGETIKKMKAEESLSYPLAIMPSWPDESLGDRFPYV